MVIIAGPNGSGKTTLAPFFLKKIGIKEFINTDEIARGLSPYNPEGQAIKAGKISIKRLEESLSQGVSFAVETTLAGQHLVKYTKQARAAGYKVVMIYLYTEDIKINILRIANRKKQGEHFVPTVDVKRRYKRSFRNLFEIFPYCCDTIELYITQHEVPQFVAAGGMLGESPIWSFRADQSELWGRIQKQLGENNAE